MNHLSDPIMRYQGGRIIRPVNNHIKYGLCEYGAMARQELESNALPEGSQRAELAERRSFFAEDEQANQTLVATMFTLIIGYGLVLFVALILRPTIVGPVNDVCDDVASGNETQQTCDELTDAASMYNTVLLIAGVAVLIAVIGLAIGTVKSGGFGGKGGRNR